MYRKTEKNADLQETKIFMETERQTNAHRQKTNS